MKDKIINDTKEKMEKCLTAFQAEMTKVRTGRASLGLVDSVRVDYYGQMVPLSQVGTLSIPDPKLITIAPWEQSLIPAIENAIKQANIGLNPVSDGKLIRLPVPPLNEERRKDIVKMLKKHGEDSRVAIRHVRREAVDAVKKLEKEGTVTEDDSKKASALIQKLTDDSIKRIDDGLEKKEKEIMQV